MNNIKQCNLCGNKLRKNGKKQITINLEAAVFCTGCFNTIKFIKERITNGTEDEYGPLLMVREADKEASAS